MADQPAEAKPEVKKSATELSESVGSDRYAYSEVMSEMRKMEKSNPTAAKEFEGKVAENIDFNTAALYDVKVNFGIIDTNGDARVQRDELKAYADPKNKDTNDLQKRFVNEHILKNYDSVANLSSDRWNSYFRNDTEIRLTDLDRGIKDKGTVEAFFKKNADGISLYDRTKDKKDGSVDGLEDILENPTLHGLTPEQTKAAQFMYDKSTNNWFAADEYDKNSLKAKVAGYGINPDAATPKAESKAEVPANKVVEQPAKKDEPNKAEQQLKMPAKVEDKKAPPAEMPKAKIEDKKEPVAEVPAVKAEENKDAEAAPNADLIKMATVRNGEGPWHSAERILKAGGGKADLDEVRALSNALKTVYKESHGDLNDLHSKHEFINKDNFKKVMENVKNPRVREILKKMSAA